jgi:hypothetical protein
MTRRLTLGVADRGIEAHVIELGRAGRADKSHFVALSISAARGLPTALARRINLAVLATCRAAGYGRGDLEA